MTKLLDDLNVITSLPSTVLSNLCSLSEDVIAHAVFEEMIEGRNIFEVDIGIGILYIKHEGDSVKYRFTPSRQLEGKVSSTITTRRSTLADRAEESLKSKVEKTYKELL